MSCIDLERVIIVRYAYKKASNPRVVVLIARLDETVETLPSLTLTSVSHFPLLDTRQQLWIQRLRQLQEEGLKKIVRQNQHFLNYFLQYIHKEIFRRQKFHHLKWLIILKGVLFYLM